MGLWPELCDPPGDNEQADTGHERHRQSPPIVRSVSLACYRHRKPHDRGRDQKNPGSNDQPSAVSHNATRLAATRPLAASLCSSGVGEPTFDELDPGWQIWPWL